MNFRLKRLTHSGALVAAAIGTTSLIAAGVAVTYRARRITCIEDRISWLAQRLYTELADYRERVQRAANPETPAAEACNLLDFEQIECNVPSYGWWVTVRQIMGRRLEVVVTAPKMVIRQMQQHLDHCQLTNGTFAGYTVTKVRSQGELRFVLAALTPQEQRELTKREDELIAYRAAQLGGAPISPPA